MPAGFDTFKFETNLSLKNEIASKMKKHIPQEIYYVDGACKANGKPECQASWAVVAEFDQELKEAGLVQDAPSNQSAELTAAIRACEIAKSRQQDEITIVTDSKYLHGAVTQWIDKWQANEWKDHRNKPVINVDLFKSLQIAKSGLQIEWIHVKGHTGVEGNVRVDALARSLLDEDNTFFAIMSCNHNIQSEDEELDILKEQIREGLRQDLVVENGLVFYLDPRIQIGDSKRLFVPKSSRLYMLRLAHDNQLYGGHLGVKKTASKLTRFWWRGMLADIEAYVRSCAVCQAHKGRVGLPPGFLHSIPVSKIFQHVHIDIIGPVICQTVRGNRYIITATDAFSKYVFAKPYQSVKTCDVAAFLEEQILASHGAPDVIITDQGSQFMSEEWKRIMDKNNITHLSTTSHHPQTNGIDERVNGTIVRILKSYTDEFQSNWDLELKWALYNYNTTIHSSTNFSPYHLMHGMDPRSPFNNHLSVESRDSDLSKIRSFIRREAAKQNAEAQEAQKRAYDRHRSPIRLRIGQRVWVKEHNCPAELSRKFSQKWYGPCVITSILGSADNPRTVEVLDCEYFTKKFVAIQDLKLHNERPPELEETRHDSVSESENGAVPNDLHGSQFFVGNPRIADTLISDQDDSDAGEETQPEEHPPDNQIAECAVPGTPSDRLSIRPMDLAEDGPTSSSPKRRVTFSSQLTEFAPNASFIDQPEDDEPSTGGSQISELKAVNPYIMDFIIDNTRVDRDFDPNSSEHDSTSDTVEENDNQGTADNGPKYNLRRLPHRISANYQGGDIRDKSKPTHNRFQKQVQKHLSTAEQITDNSEVSDLHEDCQSTINQENIDSHTSEIQDSTILSQPATDSEQPEASRTSQLDDPTDLSASFADLIPPEASELDPDCLIDIDP